MVRSFFGLGLLLTSLTTFAQDARWSGGMMNGYAWRQMDDIARTYYVAGIIDASSTLETDDPRKLVDLDKCKCTAGQIIEGINNFFRTATGPSEKYMRLPILTVVTGEYWRRSGQSLEKIAVVYTMMLAEIDKLEKTQKTPH